jgi:small redox-active disulfide protein 2
MNIKILGTGCPNCKKLEASVLGAIRELELEAEVDKITEIQDIVNYGVMSLPAIVVDGEVLLSGKVPDIKEIKELLIKGKEKKSSRHCSCSCGC